MTVIQHGNVGVKKSFHYLTYHSRADWITIDAVHNIGASTVCGNNVSYKLHILPPGYIIIQSRNTGGPL
jgi:hypothetical protein